MQNIFQKLYTKWHFKQTYKIHKGLKPSNLSSNKVDLERNQNNSNTDLSNLKNDQSSLVSMNTQNFFQPMEGSGV